MGKAKKRVSKIARGKMSKAVVFRGNKEKTVSGLKKSDLIKSKRGKIVSKKASAAGKRAFAFVRSWNQAVMKARKALNLKGFVAINGKTAQGKAVFAKAKSFYSQ